jgi:hypothetical protein
MRPDLRRPPVRANSSKFCSLPQSVPPKYSQATREQSSVERGFRLRVEQLREGPGSRQTTYSWLLRKAAQRFFCAAAIRLRASGLRTRFFRVAPDLPELALTGLADVLPLCFGGLPTRRPISERTWAICSSIFCFCDSRPCRAASRISVFGAAVFAIYKLVTHLEKIYYPDVVTIQNRT